MCFLLSRVADQVPLVARAHEHVAAGARGRPSRRRSRPPLLGLGLARTQRCLVKGRRQNLKLVVHSATTTN